MSNGRCVYVAQAGLEDVLHAELGPKAQRMGRLFIADQRTSYWAQNVWYEAKEFKFNSISEAANHLRGIQRNWWLHPNVKHRRAQLIQDALPPIRPKPIEFLSELPKLPLGSWTLLDENTMLYSNRCSSLFPEGEVAFIENKADPPSRAYLKLWEFFTLERAWPIAGERVIDVGSSPGGWTWVLDQLGASVLSVDKAPLTVKTSERVEYLSESAFALEPRKVDWFFSDIICYPERLLELVTRWLAFSPRFVCTIKFQGPTNNAIVAEFLKIPGSKVTHLSANKHELTWFRVPNCNHTASCLD